MLHLQFMVMTPAVLLAWWLSGYDSRVTGEDKIQDFLRRAVRCAITVGLVELALLNCWLWRLSSDQIRGLMFLASMLPLAFLWSGCVSELFARVFRHLIDPEDKRAFDPDQTNRDLDAVARLVRSNRKREAIRLCQKLKESGDANILAMETMLEQLGVPSRSFKISRPLTAARDLRMQGKFNEAKSLLKSLLAKDPANVAAAIMLIRLYAQDLRQRDQAEKTLGRLAQQQHVPRAFIDYAQGSMDEWCEGSRPTEAPEASSEPPAESVDELLASGQLGTAIEIMEQQIKEQPRDFELWMKYAEAHGRHCGNVKRAEKIIQKIENDPTFGPEQIRQARIKLAEWQKRC